MPNYVPEQCFVALQMRNEGKKLREIGAALGVGPERARGMIGAAQRGIPAPIKDLSIRAQNALSHLGFALNETLAQELSATLTYEQLFNARYCGVTTADEIAKWIEGKGYKLERKQKPITDKTKPTKTEQRYIDYLSARGYVITQPD